MSEQQFFITMRPGETFGFRHNRGTRDVSVVATTSSGDLVEVSLEVVDENEVEVTALDYLERLVFRWPRPEPEVRIEPLR